MSDQYCAIKDLKTEFSQVTIVGLVIAKTQLRTFQTDNSERGVMNITLRDESRSTINCSIWGSAKYVESFDNIYKIGHVLSISKPKVGAKRTNKKDYKPLTYSPFELTINEESSKVQHATGETRSNLITLQNELFKPTVTALKLDDLVSKGARAINVLADFVVVVRAVQPVCNVTTKFGTRALRKIIVMDESHQNVTLNIWGGDYIQRANEWSPLRTVLHLVDAQANYTKFDSAVTLSMVGRTVIIENPSKSSRVTALQHYVTEMACLLKPLPGRASSSAYRIDVASINVVMTIGEVHDLLSTNGDGNERQITALVYAVVCKFNLDTTNEFGPISKYCRTCSRILKRSANKCDDPNCVHVLTESGELNYVEKFNIYVDLFDHTGTLKNCRLQDEYAAKVLGHDARNFATLLEDDIDALHNRFMLERFGAKLVVKRQLRPFIQIVDLIPFDYMTEGVKLKV